MRVRTISSEEYANRCARTIYPGLVTEDFCGVEPFTHPPEPLETRPPLDIDYDKVQDAYHETDSALVGG